MKRFANLLLAASLASTHSCITLQGGYSGQDESGRSWNVSVGGEFPWPKVKEPALPQWDGKNPVPVAP